MIMKRTIVAAALSVAVTGTASAATLTTMSPTSAGELPAGVSAVGGIVVDLVGANGNRVVSQLAASSLFVGFASTNPFDIGTQGGFDASVTGALGGGIAEASFRFTLFDGDTAPGNFDEDDNTLQVNGLEFGNWSDVQTVETDGVGNILSGPDAGFNNNDLDTGFFFSTDTILLASLFSSIVATESLTFSLTDVDPFDNFFDFTLGIDGSLIDVGSGPVVQPPVGVIPLPPTILMMLAAIAALLGVRLPGRRRAA